MTNVFFDKVAILRLEEFYYLELSNCMPIIKEGKVVFIDEFSKFSSFMAQLCKTEEYEKVNAEKMEFRAKVVFLVHFKNKIKIK